MERSCASSEPESTAESGVARLGGECGEEKATASPEPGFLPPPPPRVAVAPPLVWSVEDADDDDVVVVVDPEPCCGALAVVVCFLMCCLSSWPVRCRTCQDMWACGKTKKRGKRAEEVYPPRAARVIVGRHGLEHFPGGRGGEVVLHV